MFGVGFSPSSGSITLINGAVFRISGGPKMPEEKSYPTVKPFFRWYDLWIGFYYDRRDRRLFFLPIPMCGLVFDFGPRQETFEITKDGIMGIKKGHHYVANPVDPKKNT